MPACVHADDVRTDLEIERDRTGGEARDQRRHMILIIQCAPARIHIQPCREQDMW